MVAMAGWVAAEPRRPAGPPWPMHVIDAERSGADGVKMGDINRDGHADIATGFEEGASTRVYFNPGPSGVRKPWPRVAVGETPAAEDAVFADLDGDGRLDVVTSTEGDARQVFVHWAPAAADDLLKPAAWRQDRFAAVAGLSRWMYAEPLQLDGEHGVDLVIGGKIGGGTKNSTLGWLQAPAAARDTAAWSWHPLIEMQWTMSIHLEDMDGDGDRDVLYSERYGNDGGVWWLENAGPAMVAAGTPWPRHRVGATGFAETMLLSTHDVDGDGMRDVAVAVRRAKTDSTNPAQHSHVAWLKRLDATGRRWRETILDVPEQTGAVKSVAIGDMDGDERADLVVSCEHARGDRSGVYWLRGGGAPEAPRWAAQDIAGTRGIKFDLVRLLDVEGDGDLDVVTTEEQEGGRGLGVIWYENPHAR